MVNLDCLSQLIKTIDRDGLLLLKAWNMSHYKINKPVIDLINSELVRRENKAATRPLG